MNWMNDKWIKGNPNWWSTKIEPALTETYTRIEIEINFMYGLIGLKGNQYTLPLFVLSFSPGKCPSVYEREYNVFSSSYYSAWHW